MKWVDLPKIMFGPAKDYLWQAQKHFMGVPKTMFQIVRSSVLQNLQRRQRQQVTGCRHRTVAAATINYPFKCLTRPAFSQIRNLKKSRLADIIHPNSCAIGNYVVY